MNECGDQEFCEVFDSAKKLRCHWHRLNEKCIHYGKAMCPQLTGQACDVNKMRRLRSQNGASCLDLNEAWH